MADLAVGSTLIRGSEWGLLWDAGFMGLTSYVPLLLDFAEASFGYLAYHVLLFSCFMLSGIAALALWPWVCTLNLTERDRFAHVRSWSGWNMVGQEGLCILVGK